MKKYSTIIQQLGSIGSNNIYMKREDLYPFSFGGNKARIGQEYFIDLFESNYDSIVSYGSPQSNLNRVIANIAAREGIGCYIVSSANNAECSVNQKICELCDAEIISIKKENVQYEVKNVLSYIRSKGKNPYYIYGDEYGQGRKDIPLRAYQKVFGEILEQEKEYGVEFDQIYLAVGTGTTISGLIKGASKTEYLKDFIGISIARKRQDVENHICEYLHWDSPEKCLEITDEFLCGGYGKFSTEISNEKISLFKNYGIPTDTTYTAKAFYGMKQYISQKNIQGKNILFLHTGGTPLFFDELNSMS